MRSHALLGVATWACSIACGGDDGGATASLGGSNPSGPADTSDASTAVASSGSATSATDDAESSDTNADSTGEPPMGYDDPALWMCHPSKPAAEDLCLASDLTATELLADGTTQIVEHVPAGAPAFDCFYVYPTVDIDFTPGQTEDFDDTDQELDALLNQAARLTSMCRVFAPLYHQVTLGTFGSADAPALLDAAYADVLAAFENFLETSEDRSFVILGHSQGTFMTTRLMQEVIEPDPALRERLIAALLIGGSLSVPPGTTVGGTFGSIALCESDDEVGCVIAYRSYAAEYPPAAGNQSPDIRGNDVACTHPAALAGGPARFAGAIFPTFTHQPAVFPAIDPGVPVDTPFVLYRDFFSAECMADGDGLGFLSISVDAEPNDMRTNPIDFANPLFNPGFLGLHVLDYDFAMQDLLDQVAAKAAAKGL
jgi:hypothetical protein